MMLALLTQAGNLTSVNWLDRVMAMVMLALWLPATSLCLAERAGWISRDGCCPSHSEKAPSSQPSGDSACCTLASASYKADDDQRVTMISPVVAFVLLADLSEFASLTDASPAVALTAIPPELPVSWQFSHRTALAPRAPSFVS